MPEQNEPRQTGAVLVFSEGTPEQVQAFLSTLQLNLEATNNPVQIESFQVDEFNPNHGGPVFYVP